MSGVEAALLGAAAVAASASVSTMVVPPVAIVISISAVILTAAGAITGVVVATHKRNRRRSRSRRSKSDESINILLESEDSDDSLEESSSDDGSDLLLDTGKGVLSVDFPCVDDTVSKCNASVPVISFTENEGKSFILSKLCGTEYVREAHTTKLVFNGLKHEGKNIVFIDTPGEGGENDDILLDLPRYLTCASAIILVLNGSFKSKIKRLLEILNNLTTPFQNEVIVVCNYPHEDYSMANQYFEQEINPVFLEELNFTPDGQNYIYSSRFNGDIRFSFKFLSNMRSQIGQNQTTLDEIKEIASRGSVESQPFLKFVDGRPPENILLHSIPEKDRCVFCLFRKKTWVLNCGHGACSQCHADYVKPGGQICFACNVPVELSILLRD